MSELKDNLIAIREEKNRITPEKIKQGESVFGVSGTNADTSDATAIPSNIVEGNTAYVDNRKIEGTICECRNSGTGFNVTGAYVNDTYKNFYVQR